MTPNERIVDKLIEEIVKKKLSYPELTERLSGLWKNTDELAELLYRIALKLEKNDKFKDIFKMAIQRNLNCVIGKYQGVEEQKLANLQKWSIKIKDKELQEQIKKVSEFCYKVSEEADEVL